MGISKMDKKLMLQDSPSDSETGVGTNNYNLRDKML